MALSRIIQKDIVEITDQVSDELRQLSGATLLISGGAGFIGSYFLDVVEHANKHVLDRSCRVYCIDNMITAVPDRIRHLSRSSNITVIRADISAPMPIQGNVDFVVHAAGIASPTYYRLYPLEAMRSSTDGLRNILDFARAGRARSILFFSSSEIYGDPTSEHIPTPESYKGNVSCVGPRACYDESKRFGETLCAVYRRLFNLPIKIVRPGNIYGPGMRLEDKRVIPDLMGNVLRGEDIRLLSDGRPTRCFCYITDAMVGFLKVMLSSENTEFNISNDEREISMLGLAEEVVRLGHNENLRISYERSNDAEYLTDNPSRRHLDLTKARTVLGYSPRIGLLEGLGRTLAWYREEYGSGRGK